MSSCDLRSRNFQTFGHLQTHCWGVRKDDKMIQAFHNKLLWSFQQMLRWPSCKFWTWLCDTLQRSSQRESCTDFCNLWLHLMPVDRWVLFCGCPLLRNIHLNHLNLIPVLPVVHSFWLSFVRLFHVRGPPVTYSFIDKNNFYTIKWFDLEPSWESIRQ